MNTVHDVMERVYEKSAFQIKDYVKEVESLEYSACHFKLNGSSCICRHAKLTPKKVGLFVTFWKRRDNGPIEPFNTGDDFDFFIVNVHSGERFGQFVFPKSELIKQGIISTDLKEGKRAFRVYPPWENVNNKQAEKTQKWQTPFFY